MNKYKVKKKVKKRIQGLVAYMCIVGMLISVMLTFTSTSFAAGSQKGLFAGKYGKAQIFDTRRDPAFPEANKSITLSNFGNIFNAIVGGQFHSSVWGIQGDRYVQFIDTGLADQVKLNLYEANGTFVQTISDAGSVWGLGEEGFLYVASSCDYGYFISNKEGYAYGGSLTYRPKTGKVEDIKKLEDYDANTTVVDVGGALVAAKEKAEKAEYLDMTQAVATSEVVIKDALKATAMKEVNDSSIGVVINKVSYTVTTDSSNGSYVFTVTVSKSSKTETTSQKTIAIIATDSLATAKTNAKLELDNYKYTADYTTNASALASAISTGKTNIDSATTTGEVATALANAKTSIDEIESDESIAARKLAAATAAVVTAEDSKTNATRTAAQTLVTALPDGPDKTDLQARLDAIVTAEALAQAKISKKSEIDAVVLTVEEKEGKTAASILLAEAKLTELKDTAKSLVTSAEDIAAVNAISVDKSGALALLVGQADLTAYNEALAGVKEADYTETSWTTYQEVVTANVVTVENTQAEVTTATSNITAAQIHLVTKAAAQAAADLETTKATITGLIYTDLVVENMEDATKKAAVEAVVNAASLPTGVTARVNADGSQVTLSKALAEDLVVVTNATFKLSVDAQAALDAAGFKTTHTSILGKTVDTVSIENKTLVTAALGAYDGLSSEAQAKVSEEKALLDNLLVKIGELDAAAALAAAKEAKNDEIDAVVLTVEEKEGKTAASILLAEAKLTELKDAAKGIVTAAEDIAAVNAISVDKSGALALLVGQADLTAYNEALAAVTEADYTEASWTTYQGVVTANVVTVENTQAEVTTATSNITAAQIHLVTKAAAQAAADLETTKATITGLIYTDLVVENMEDATKKAAVEAVVNTASLPTGVTARVNADGSQVTLSKALAKDLVVATNATFKLSVDAQASLDAQAFKTTHTSILEKTVDTVSIEDKTLVTAALGAYDGLSSEAQAKLVAGEKALLDNLLVKIGELDAAAALAAAKEAKNDEIDAVVLTVEEKEGKTAASILLAEAKLTELKDAAKGIVTAAEDIAAVNAISVDKSGALALLVGQADLTAYNEALAAVTEADYTEASWTTYQGVVTANVVTVENTQAEVDAAKDNIIAAQIHLVTKAAAQAAADLETTKATITGLIYTDLVVENMEDATKKAAVEAVLNTASLPTGVTARVNADGSQVTLSKALAEDLVVATNATFKLSVDAQASLDAQAFKTTHTSILEKTVDTVSIEDKTLVTAARAGFDLLSDAAKAKLVSGEEGKLATVEAKITALEEAAEKLQAAKDKVEAAESTKTDATRTAAQTLVTALPDGPEKTGLQDRLDAIEITEDPSEDQVLAGKASDLITKIPGAGNVTLEDKKDIEAARSAYEELTASQKALVENLALLEAAEAKLAEIEKALEAAETAKNNVTKAEAQSLKDALPEGPGKTDLKNRLDAIEVIDDEDEVLAGKASDLITKIPGAGNVTLEDKEDIETARSSYEELTASQKALVENLALLEAAEAELKEIEKEIEAAEKPQAVKDKVEAAEAEKTNATKTVALTLVAALISIIYINRKNKH